MLTMTNRRHFILALVAAPLMSASSFAASPTSVKAYRNPGCGCCEKWVAHMQAAGFAVTMEDDPDLDARRTALGVPANLAGCHTSIVGNYIIEGHVPAEDVIRFLQEKPDALGLAVPGMPMGSPGMEVDGQSERYQVIAFKEDGTSVVFAER
jgi:hypothetical protein